MTIKDALYREFKYGLCGIGGVLHGLVDPTRVKHYLRNRPSATKKSTEYPYIVFRRVTKSQNKVRYTRERVEVEIIGLQADSKVGDDMLEQIEEILITYMDDTTKKWGQFTSSGTPDSTQGLGMTCRHISSVEGYSPEMDEKAHILIFAFYYLRP